jgi:hypothetical protein
MNPRQVAGFDGFDVFVVVGSITGKGFNGSGCVDATGLLGASSEKKGWYEGHLCSGAKGR